MAEKSSSSGMKVNLNSTKNEILKAYSELLEQQKEVKSPQPQQEIEMKRKDTLVKEASGQSEEKIIQQIATLKMALNSSLDSIEDQLNTSYKKLNKTQEAIQIQEERLKEMYQINAEADSLSALLAAQKEKKTEFETFMATEKEKWEKDQKEKAAFRKEEDEALKKQRLRGEEEYNYTVHQKRKIESDQYEEKKIRQEKELKDKKEAFELEIKTREQAVSESENELKSLRKQTEEFPAVLKKEAETAVKITGDNLKKEFDYQNVLLKKEYESELKLNSQAVENLQNRIKDLELQLKQAFAKTDSAEKNVKEITVKAIESNAAIRTSEQQKYYPESGRTPKES
jgi:hypothetical protein